MKAVITYVILILSAAAVMQCHPAKSAKARGDGSEQLYLFRWELTELRGKPVQKSERVQPFLLFEPGEPGQLSGSVGCNQMAGTFTLGEDQSILISPVITTRMACPDQDLEYAFSSILRLIDKWTLEGESLVLSKSDKPAATFKAAPGR